MTDPLTLAAEFPPATEAQWRALVDGVLKGGAFEKLVGKTYDGLSIQPIYPRQANAQLIAGREATRPWQIMQRVDHPDAAQASALALHDLENGATGLTLVFAGSNGARGFGLPPTADAIARALDGVYLDAGVAIDFDIGAQSHDVVSQFADLVAAQGVKPADVEVRFGFDPIGAAAVHGGSLDDWNATGAALADGVKALAGQGFRGPFVVADGRVIHDAGGTEAQELAFVLASGVAYLRVLEANGIGLDSAQTMIYARLSADADQFLDLAKFRALRLLWARVEQACGLTQKPLFIAAETAWRMLTQRDPNVNMLRATSAVFSAGLGGANSIVVLPHTLALGLPDQLARRIARNTQLILLEESNLAKVADPAAGAGGIETLTQQLCASAWALFQEIEGAGGVSAALEQNLIGKHVAAARTARDKNIARRKDALTGTSEFPNLHEQVSEVLAPLPANRATEKVSFDALAPTRLAASFERLRDASDAILAKTGARPKVFLGLLGTPADFTARAMFAKSFFESGGIEAVDSEDFTSSKAALACLCSSDKVYAEQAATAAKALQAAGAKHIYLAGRPGELESSLREAGIGDFVFAGGDAIVTLTTAYEKLKA